MIVDLKKIFANDNATLPLEHTLDMSALDVFDQFPLKSGVTLDGNVSSSAGLVKLSAKIGFVYDAPCDRCGADTAKSHSVTVDKLLAVSIEGDDSDTIIIVPDMKLDLDELIYTETVVSLPTKHLCGNDCKGVCTKCGNNLNKGECGCPKKEIDPRLAALADLLNE